MLYSNAEDNEEWTEKRIKSVKLVFVLYRINQKANEEGTEKRVKSVKLVFVLFRINPVPSSEIYPFKSPL